MESTYNDSVILMTPQEKTMLDHFSGKYAEDHYHRLFQAIKVTRVTTSVTKNKDGTEVEGYEGYSNIDPTLPFCAYVNLIEEIEGSDTTKEIIGMQWLDAKGVTLRSSCGLIVELPVETNIEIKPTPEQTSAQVVDATVTLKDANGVNQTLLSAEQVKELTQTIKKCPRAKNYLMPLTGAGKYLTVADYDTATRLNLDCAYVQMENEFNK